MLWLSFAAAIGVKEQHRLSRGVLEWANLVQVLHSGADLRLPGGLLLFGTRAGERIRRLENPT